MSSFNRREAAGRSRKSVRRGSCQSVHTAVLTRVLKPDGWTTLQIGLTRRCTTRRRPCLKLPWIQTQEILNARHSRSIWGRKEAAAVLGRGEAAPGGAEVLLTGSMLTMRVQLLWSAIIPSSLATHTTSSPRRIGSRSCLPPHRARQGGALPTDWPASLAYPRGTSGICPAVVLSHRAGYGVRPVSLSSSASISCNTVAPTLPIRSCTRRRSMARI